ncbi:MAG: GntR family transcriptional regulator [Proteobacteria bacterium]|nr:GntR family transcriptional regulator [Burkholderiales bacterium]
MEVVAVGMPPESALTATMPERIARVLAQRITEGRLDPGQRLVEANLAAEFGVSHGPVRDALRALERAGLVTIAPYRGAIVREVSAREVTEMYQVRAALVGLRARWIAEDVAHGAFETALAPRVAALRALTRAPGSADAYVEAALAINRAFTESVANPWLRSMLESLSIQTARYTRLGLQDASRRRESAAAWNALLKAIGVGDGDAAERIARANSLALRDAAIRALEERAVARPPAMVRPPAAARPRAANGKRAIPRAGQETPAASATDAAGGRRPRRARPTTRA